MTEEEPLQPLSDQEDQRQAQSALQVRDIINEP